MEKLKPILAAIAAALLLAPAVLHAGDKPPDEGMKQKKGVPSLKIPTSWDPAAAAGHWFFHVGIGTGTGYLKGKVYGDNPKTTDVENDGPSIRDTTTDTGPIVRWSAGYILKRGLGFSLFARYQITNGSTPGYDTAYDAWILGVRVLRLIYVKGNLNILPFLCLGYGTMRHIIHNTILPKGRSGDYYRATGSFDAGLGATFLYRFTPVFSFFIDLGGDVMFPRVSINLDAVIGLGLSY
jgi:hypothetical protein